MAQDERDVPAAEEQAKQKMLEQATQTQLEPQQTVDPILQQVKTNELLDASQKTIGAPTVDKPAVVDGTQFVQSPPTVTPAEEYRSAQAEPKVGEAKAAQGNLSNNTIMTAAQGSVSPASLATAATAELDQRATTQYQLAQLMASVSAGKPMPPWASPAVRKVSGLMNARGLGTSSMASAAMVQAVIESGIPIAEADANKYATIQLKNLSNEQEATLQNAATMAAMDMANLNNRQVAAVNNAKAFLSLDLANLDNEQKSNTITYQSKVSALLSDTAAENAARQFNAKSQNEVNMFYEELASSITNTSLNRVASLEQFNINTKVAVDEFNAQMETTRDQFNANMRMQIDQSNATWRRNINTANTATLNDANRQNVLNLLGIQQNALNNMWQAYRDQASWNMKVSENAKDRAHNAAMQSAAIAANKDMYEDKFEDYLIVTTIDNIFS
jgi:hypothetical protein